MTNVLNLQLLESTESTLPCVSSFSGCVSSTSIVQTQTQIKM